MTSFTAVTSGANTMATDINQLINALNGTTNSQLIPTQVAATSSAILARFTATPGSDLPLVQGIVSGDSGLRTALYIRSDGYGGLEVGNGGSATGHIYGYSGGLKTTEALAVGTTFSCDATAITSSGSGGLNLVGMTASGAISANQIKASFANGNFYDGSAAFNGTGTGTYTHGLNHTPTYVGVTPQPGSGSTTSMGSDAVGSTTVHIDINGAFAFQAWAVLN